MLSIVVAMAHNGVIGLDGTIPWRLPGDQKRVKATTMGHVLVMGRRTFESIGRPLPGRTTVVVTSQPDWQPAEVIVARGLPEALARAREVDPEVFVFGGAGVYAEALPLADRLLVTWVDGAPAGDTFFPAVDWAGWDEVDSERFAGGAWSTYLRHDRDRAEAATEPGTGG